MYQNYNTRAQLLFCLLSLLFSDVAVVVILNSLLVKLFQGRLYFRQSSIPKEHVCFKYFVGMSAKKEKKKKKSCSEESL